MLKTKELFVGPFPCEIKREEREKLFKHFNAINVIHISQRSKEIYAIGVFETQDDCDFALRNIHQIKILNTRITAKYNDASKLRKSILLSKENLLRVFALDGYPPQFQNPNPCRDPNESRRELDNGAGCHLRESLSKYEEELSAISSSFGVNFPISPKLRYSYPPATPSVVFNVALNLLVVPKFYNQVLHLMNRMHLASPFGPVPEDPWVYKVAKAMTNLVSGQPQMDDSVDVQMTDENLEKRNPGQLESSDSESELESEEDSSVNPSSNKLCPPKRVLKPKRPKIRKKPKLEVLKQLLIGADMKSANRGTKEANTSLESVFETPNIPSKKKFVVNIHPTTDVDNVPADTIEKDVNLEGFGKMYPNPKSTEDPKRTLSFISAEELASNRINECDWPVVPVFKNYNAGTPSSRLYIKNLAKTVTESDLNYIFGGYVPTDNEEESTKFTIRLMKEGRMKGQAFVNFASESAASLALTQVNGFILKDKPMVVMFGKIKTNE